MLWPAETQYPPITRSISSKILTIDICSILPSYKSHNASGKYPTVHHFVIEHMHHSVTTWCIVGYGTNALWDLWWETDPIIMRTNKNSFITFLPVVVDLLLSCSASFLLCLAESWASWSCSGKGKWEKSRLCSGGWEKYQSREGRKKNVRFYSKPQLGNLRICTRNPRVQQARQTEKKEKKNPVKTRSHTT